MYPQRKNGTGYEPDLYDPNGAVVGFAAIAAADKPVAIEQIDLDFPIYDQDGDNACVGFSIKECAQIVTRWQTQGRVLTSVSPGWLWWGGKKALGWESQNRGCRIGDAVAFARENGIAYSDNMLWTPGSYGPPPADAWEQAKDHPLIDAEAVTRTSEVETSLLNKHPVVLGMTLTESFDEIGRDGKFLKPAGKTIGGHAMTVVGYDQGFEWDWCPPGALRVRNHWTSRWGNDGWLWLPYSIFDSSTVDDCYVLRVVKR